MKPAPWILIAAAVVAATLGVLAAMAPRPDSPELPPSVAARAELVQRGEYLVHRVGMCVDCHSPRDATGQFVENKHLTGRLLTFATTGSPPRTPFAPGIAGLPAGFTEHDLAHFLMSGERPHGRPPPLPPMPQYRLNPPDAEAVAAYLASLPAGDR